MKKRLLPWIILMTFLTGAVLFNACSAAPEATPTAEETQADAAELPEPTVVEVPEMAAEPEQVSECISCHLDKDRLISTSDPAEETVEENEGAG